MRANFALGFLISTCAFGQIAVQVGGKPVGTANTINFTNAAGASASGILHSCTPREGRIDCTASYNTAFIASHDTIHENENYCSSTNGTSAYTCKLPFKSLTAYRAGMTFLLSTDATCSSSCTLNIDGAGIVSVKRPDGTTDPGGAIVKGQPQWIFYDGKVFRLMATSGAPVAETPSFADQRGDVRARRVMGAMDTMPYASSITLDVTAGDLHKTTTSNNIGNASLDAATAGLAGQHMWIIIANDQISAKTITFGPHLRSAGPLTGTAGKAATLHFISDGTGWYEVARTLGL